MNASELKDAVDRIMGEIEREVRAAVGEVPTDEYVQSKVRELRSLVYAVLIRASGVKGLGIDDLPIGRTHEK